MVLQRLDAERGGGRRGGWAETGFLGSDPIQELNGQREGEDRMAFLRLDGFFSLAIAVICKTAEMMPSSPRWILHYFLLIYQKASLFPL